MTDKIISCEMDISKMRLLIEGPEFCSNNVGDFTISSCGNQVIKVEAQQNNSQEVDKLQTLEAEYILPTDEDVLNYTLKLELEEHLNSSEIKTEPPDLPVNHTGNSDLEVDPNMGDNSSIIEENTVAPNAADFSTNCINGTVNDKETTPLLENCVLIVDTVNGQGTTVLTEEIANRSDITKLSKHFGIVRDAVSTCRTDGGESSVIVNELRIEMVADGVIDETRNVPVIAELVDDSGNKENSNRGSINNGMEKVCEILGETVCTCKSKLTTAEIGIDCKLLDDSKSQTKNIKTEENCAIREDIRRKPETFEKSCQTSRFILGPSDLPKCTIVLDQLPNIQNHFGRSSKDIPKSAVTFIGDKTAGKSFATVTIDTTPEETRHHVSGHKNDKKKVIKNPPESTNYSSKPITTNKRINRVITVKESPVSITKSSEQLAGSKNNVKRRTTMNSLETANSLYKSTIYNITTNAVIAVKESPFSSPESLGESAVTKNKGKKKIIMPSSESANCSRKSITNNEMANRDQTVKDSPVSTPEITGQSAAIKKPGRRRIITPSPEPANYSSKPIKNNEMANGVISLKDSPVSTPEVTRQSSATKKPGRRRIIMPSPESENYSSKPIRNNEKTNEVITAKDSPVQTPESAGQSTAIKNIGKRRNITDTKTSTKVDVAKKIYHSNGNVEKVVDLPLQISKVTPQLSRKKRKVFKTCNQDPSPEPANYSSKSIRNNEMANGVTTLKDFPAQTTESTGQSTATEKKRGKRRIIMDLSNNPSVSKVKPVSSKRQLNGHTNDTFEPSKKITEEITQNCSTSASVTALPEPPDTISFSVVKKATPSLDINKKMRRKTFGIHNDLKCRVCGNYFENEVVLRRHKRIHVPPSICSICGEKFSMKHGLKQHISIVHRKERMHKCNYCDKSYGRQDSLETHLDTLHYTEQPYHCTICDEKICFSKEFKNHVNLHLGKTMHNCNECGRSFKSDFLLKKHVWTMHPIDKCNLCDKVFTSLWDRKYHRLQHLKPKVCDVCNASFPRSSQVKDHIRRVHTKEYPYKCPVCDKAFASSGEMHKHKTTHSDVKNRLCDFCGKGFKRADTLKIHRKLVHGVIVPRERPRRKMFTSNLKV